MASGSSPHFILVNSWRIMNTDSIFNHFLCFLSFCNYIRWVLPQTSTFCLLYLVIIIKLVNFSYFLVGKWKEVQMPKKTQHLIQYAKVMKDQSFFGRGSKVISSIYIHIDFENVCRMMMVGYDFGCIHLRNENFIFFSKMKSHVFYKS